MISLTLACAVSALCAFPQQTPSSPSPSERELHLHPLDDLVSFADNAREGSYPFEGPAHLLSMIKTFMLPPFADSGASITMQEMDGRHFLISNLSSQQDQWLSHFLELQRGESPWMASVHLVMLQGDAAKVSLLDSQLRVQTFAKMNEMAGQKKLLVEQGMQILSEPSMQMLLRQQAMLEVSNEVHFVKNWKLEKVEPGGMQIADPNIQTVKEGLLLHAKIYQVEEDSYAMSFHVEYREIRRPIPVDKDVFVVEDKFQSYAIALPVLDTTIMDGEMRMTSGSSAQIFKPSESPGKDLVLLISLERVERSKHPQIFPSTER